MSDFQSILQERRQSYAKKPTLRVLYDRWHQWMISCLAASGKPTLELGGGGGHLKEYQPKTISTDILWCEWLDAVIDAHFLPFTRDSVGNIMMFDVLHHLASPALFFEEALHVLEPGGRIIMVEPYISPVSWCVYSFFHQEEVILSANPFAKPTQEELQKDPFYGNEAIPTLIFWKHRQQFEQQFPQFSVLQQKRFAFFAYPLSGGFKWWSLLPAALALPLTKLEEKMGWLGGCLAFRCCVVIEKRKLL